jgi:thiamine biosynthesis protein ThiS
MKLILNGESQTSSAATLSALVEQLGMKADRVAIELNREIVPRDQWAQTPLHDGDQLEIVQFVGGGSFRSSSQGGHMKKAFLLASAIATALTLSLPSAAQGPHHFQPGFNLFSKQQDVQLGEESAAQVRKQMTVINDPVLTAYVNKVGKRLVASQEAQQSGFPFTFEVVADPSINAFALPGGHMFIHTGLLKSVDNEAQLAGVMGHEMSHVILRHGTNQASKANLIELPAALAAQMAGKGSLMGQLAQLGIGLGANSVLLKFSRNAESQADLMGSHLMAESGYDPMEMARFFNKLGGLSNSPGKGFAGSVAQFMSDHPNPDNREQAIEREASLLPQQTYGYQTGDFKRMKEVVGKIHEPAPKQPQPQPTGQPRQQQ